jgi:hypothetical protein
LIAGRGFIRKAAREEARRRQGILCHGVRGLHGQGRYREDLFWQKDGGKKIWRGKVIREVVSISVVDRS